MHGISFTEAVTVFADPFYWYAVDALHSDAEPRFHRVGRSAIGRVLVVVYTPRSGDDDEETIRIISARRANAKERASYEARARD